ncbi:MAG TPA: PQQ-binding-like beta-propeller repeat protein [Pirellulales bacterium]|nr:PQQ-binding-like beta-propeller repeat protein [Pirellulales bacterium]
MTALQRVVMIGCFALASAWAGMVGAAEQSAPPRLVKAWSSQLKQEYGADGVCVRDGFIYLGTGGAEPVIAKLRVADGAVQWSWREKGLDTYQPSYPVSNGKVAVFGPYGGGNLIGLDDATGEKRWEAPALKGVLSACCFEKDLAIIGSYDHHLYAIDWTTGQIRWKTRLGEKLWSRPCVVDDRAYVGAYDGFLYGVDLADGEIKTKIDCGGRIKYDPVASHGLIFLAADEQRPPAEFDSNKERRELLVIDPDQGEIVSKFHSDSRFGPTIFEQGGTLYFHDSRHLYAYDATKRKLRWKVAAPPNMKPFPIFQGDRIVLAMNVMGREGQHEPLVATIDRATGKELSRSSTGGIVIIDFGHYRQVGDMLLTTDHRLTCYKIANGAQGD